MNEKPAWLRELFPWEQKTLSVNGRSMAYVDEGERGARPVVLLHGNPTWGFLYRDFVELFKSADAELQPRVAAARERIKQLTPNERTKP